MQSVVLKLRLVEDDINTLAARSQDKKFSEAVSLLIHLKNFFNLPLCNFNEITSFLTFDQMQSGLCALRKI